MYTEQNRSILIIKSESVNLSAAEAFIVKREWNVRSCTNLNEAILFIVSERPQFIFVSVDHPNKNIIAFIKLLLQTFPERVIVFGEKPHSLTYHHFNETGCRYNIYPPVTGPAMERVLLSYYKNQLGANPTKVQSVPLTFKYNKIQKNEAWVYKNPQTKKSDDVILTLAKASEMFAVVDEAPLGKVKFAVSEAPSQGTVTATSPEVLNGTVKNNTETNPLGKKREPLNDSAPAHESLISRAAQEALQKTVLKTNSQKIEEIKISSDMSCILVQSTRFSGYLVAALGDNREVDGVFIQALRKRIFAFLKANGEKVNEADDPLRIVVQKVNFKNWAENKAEFLRKSVHKEEEVSIAFFPRQHIRLHFEESADEKMAKVKMTEIKPDVPVEFDLYIHLEENDRYIRYTKKGAKFLATQKKRLEAQGLKYMHVFKTDIPEFNKYRAQNFLNETIEQYHSAVEA